jgi:hypothetical protein
MTIENVSWIDFESGSQRVYPRSCVSVGSEIWLESRPESRMMNRTRFDVK